MTNKAGGIQTQVIGRVTRHLTESGLNVHRLRHNPRGDIGGIPVVVHIKGHEAENASDEQIEDWLSVVELRQLQTGFPAGVLVLKRKGHMHVDHWWAVTREETFNGRFTVFQYFADWVKRYNGGEFDGREHAQNGPGPVLQAEARLGHEQASDPVGEDPVSGV